MVDRLGSEDQGSAKRFKLLLPLDLGLNEQQARHPPALPQQQQEAHPAHSYCPQQNQLPESYPSLQEFGHHQLEYGPSASPAVVTMASSDAADGAPRNDPWSNTTTFDPSWKWPPSTACIPPPPHLDASRQYQETSQVFPSLHHSPASNAPGSEATSLPTLPVTSSSTSPVDSLYSPQSFQFSAATSPPITQPLVLSDRPSTSEPAILRNGRQPANSLQSPFRDCIDTFGLHSQQRFSLPSDGKVNGYIKFSWPNRGPNQPSRRTASASDGRVVGSDDSVNGADGSVPQSSITIIGSALPSWRSVNNCPNPFNQSSTGRSMPHTPIGDTPSPPVLSNASTEVAYMGAPKMLPSQYGYDAKMDFTDRRLWMFYIRNWCPGRSVLRDTNLWLKDFAQMHKIAGVLSAIQSLAGIYIYDYTPGESIRRRVNQKFSDTERRYSQLLEDPATATNESLAAELITIAVILSMQDIVLTERRLKNPSTPRWLQGFRQGEKLLQSTDHGTRFWKTCNVQLSSLRISQSVIVGRAVILAQPMSPLPPANKFDAKKEAARFGWLLHGTEKDMFKIHGGCGFSIKLLHVLGQITYCAARLQQEAESEIVPMTAEYLHRGLLDMRQWSSESNDWNKVKFGCPVIDWVRSLPEGYQIDTDSDMTHATAEAWRLAATLYLQCRLFRLARNDHEVVSKVDDLAECIKIMPTSGSQFTAQAPLFPVFLLGVLATKCEHERVSSNWFNEVLRTPVRSSVPPLHKALQNIRSWIDREIPLPSNSEKKDLIHEREPWWEKLVDQVQQKEKEVLCLT